MDSDRYYILKRIVSPKGEGAYPQFEDIAWVIKDRVSGNEVNVYSQEKYAKERCKFRNEKLGRK